MKTIIAFDIESTGVNPSTDKIVQLSMIKLVFPSFEIIEKKKTYINPEIKIPIESTNIHNITDEIVKESPTFKQISKSCFKFINDCDYLLTHNGKKFDRTILYEEFIRCGLDWQPKPIIDTYIIMSNLIPRTLEGALKYYCGRDIEGAHDAENDVLATIDVMKGQIGKHEITNLYSQSIDENGNRIVKEFPLTDILLEKSCYKDEYKSLTWDNKIVLNDNNVPVWNFGKNKNKPVLDDLDYCDRILRSDFPTQTKNIIKFLINQK